MLWKAQNIICNQKIGKQTAKIPSDVFLFTAMGAMAISLALKIAKQDKTALFIGQWVYPILLFGIYNKLVKQQGHDKDDDGEEFIDYKYLVKRTRNRAFFELKQSATTLIL